MPSGSTRSWSSGDVYDRALPVGRRRRAVQRGARPARRHRRPRRADQRQPRLRPPAGLRRRADRRGRRAPAHRPAPRRPAGAARRRATGRSRSTPSPTSSPTLVRAEPRSCDERGHAAVLTAAMDRVRADLAGRPGTPSVVLAHAFVAGGQASDSERDISVGGVASCRRACFAGVDYAALGHLHGAQRLSETGPLQRLAARLLVLGGAPAQGRAGSSTSAAGRAPRPVEALPRRCTGRSRACAATLDDLLTDDRWARYERPLPAGDADRRRPPARARWRGCAAGSRTPWCSPSSPTACAADRRRPTPRGCAAGRPRGGRRLRRARPGEPADDDESALLARRLRGRAAPTRSAV